VIGIYADPPPEECTVLKSQRVADIGAIPLLERLTRFRDDLYDRIEHLIP